MCIKGVMERVAEFHKKFAIPIKNNPGFPATDVRRELRRHLLKEEFEEYIRAEESDNFQEVADALGDMVYVICGTALEYGIPLDRVMEAICESNLTKEGESDNGKICKGKHYYPPDLRFLYEPAAR